MKLFYKAGACSMASHIVLHELGLPFDIEAVDTEAGKTASGSDYSATNPNGYVPALQLDNGEILTEGPAILQFLADAYPELGLIPRTGTMERARTVEALTYVSSELHKAFGPLFNSTASEPEKDAARQKVAGKLNHVEALLNDGRETVLPEQFTIVDAYLFVVANWTNFVGIDLKPWPKLTAYLARVAARPATQRALQAEGLL